METSDGEELGAANKSGSREDPYIDEKRDGEKRDGDKPEDPFIGEKIVPSFVDILKSTPPPPETPIKRMRKVKLQDEVSLSIIRVCLMSIFHFSSTRRE
jgi:hypothetical protein